jgi:hypothetical protein
MAMLAEGAHGAHVALGDIRWAPKSGRLVVGDAGAVVVHTDVPEARHGAIALDPGTWRISRLREMDLSQRVVQVRD